jgi:hypothetical protein
MLISDKLYDIAIIDAEALNTLGEALHDVLLLIQHRNSSDRICEMK